MGRLHAFITKIMEEQINRSKHDCGIGDEFDEQVIANASAKRLVSQIVEYVKHTDGTASFQSVKTKH